MNIPQTLSFSEFQEKQRLHSKLVNQLLGDYLDRREHGLKHPIFDFLFDYYSFRPSLLQRYSPGLPIAIQNTSIEVDEISFPNKNYYSLCTETNLFTMQTTSLTAKRIESITWLIQLLENTQQNEPQFACLGLHEWAMLYKNEQNVRHNLTLRVSARELRQVVESKPLQCTHYDAFRFFTKDANPMNKTMLTKDHRIRMEQGGCVHTTMDIYRWAHKFYPFISSDLILEAFTLAIEARKLDMQASPYDLSEISLPPIKIETKAGAEEYVYVQKKLQTKGNGIRLKLIHELKQLKKFISMEE